MCLIYVCTHCSLTSFTHPRNVTCHTGQPLELSEARAKATSVSAGMTRCASSTSAETSISPPLS